MAAAASRARRPGIAWALGLLTGCGSASVDALAVWIDGSIDAEGNRGLQVYDRGERYSIRFQPVIPGSGTELLQLAVDERARGIVASGTRETVYMDLREGRRGRLSEELDVTRDLDPNFQMLRSGDALVRELLEPNPSGTRRLGFMALTTHFGLSPTLIDSPGAPELGSKWKLYSATAAPALFWVEQRGNPVSANGRVQAVVYPSAFAPLREVSAPTAVAIGTLQGRGIDDSNSPGRAGDTLCPDRLCVSPSGRVLTTMATEPCALWRWQWTDAIAPDTPLAATRVVLPAGCPRASDPYLVATIDDDLVVMDDELRIYMFDLGLGTMQAVPKVGDGLAPLALLTDRGRVVLYVSFAGQVTRVDRFGPRLLTTERSFCTILDSLRASPSGSWVVMSCNGQSPTEGAPDGLIMRASPLGLEQFAGINMRPIAVDDDGNALLYSFKADDGDEAPRGMFVLAGDGTLSRVDDLEPGPDSIALTNEELGRVTGRRFDATPIARDE